MSNHVAAVAATETMNLDRVQERIDVFWSWFTDNEANLSEIRLNEEGMINECHMDLVVALAEKCSEIDRDISMEIENDANGQRRLVVSANGIGSVFPIVERIFDCAPDIKTWGIVKYRQRQQDIKPLRLKDIRITPQTLRFGIFQHETTHEFGLCIFMPDYAQQDKETMHHIAFIFVDMALGEYDVATKIKTINFYDLEHQVDVHRLTIEELPEAFDQLFVGCLH